MIERLTLLAIQGQMLGGEEGWFSSTWGALTQSLLEKQYFDILINPLIIGLSAALLLITILTKNNKILMFLIAVWGYTTVIHYTIEDKGAGDVMFDFETVQATELGPLVLFFLGFISITTVLLYLAFVRGDN